MNSKHILAGLLLVLVLQEANAQFNLKRQVPEKKMYDAIKVIDSTYGIDMYEPLNFQLRGDSIRMCGNYACQSWVEDFYTTGELLHKGFYLDGQLKSYKNFYPNGNLEREFKSIDNYRSSLKLFYTTGILKSDVKYNDGGVEIWTDYNEKGIVTFSEQMDKGMVFHEFKRFFYDDGKPKLLMELKDKKKMLYSYVEYHPNGIVKVEGSKVYSEGIMDYVNHGAWKYFDETGKLIKEEEYSRGEKVK